MPTPAPRPIFAPMLLLLLLLVDGAADWALPVEADPEFGSPTITGEGGDELLVAVLLGSAGEGGEEILEAGAGSGSVGKVGRLVDGGSPAATWPGSGGGANKLEASGSVGNVGNIVSGACAAAGPSLEDWSRHRPKVRQRKFESRGCTFTGRAGDLEVQLLLFWSCKFRWYWSYCKPSARASGQDEIITKTAATTTHDFPMLTAILVFAAAVGSVTFQRQWRFMSSSILWPTYAYSNSHHSSSLASVQRRKKRVIHIPSPGWCSHAKRGMLWGGESPLHHIYIYVFILFLIFCTRVQLTETRQVLMYFSWPRYIYACPTASYRWASWVWEMTGSCSRI